VILSAVTLVLTCSFLASADFLGNRCLACDDLAKHVNKKLQETDLKDKTIALGRRIGPNGETVPSKVINYVNSEERLDDILENACDGNKKKKECYTILDDFEKEIADWFFNKPQVMQP